MVPVLDRPVMEHIVDLLDRHGFDGVIANLHYFPETIREHFGERISYRYEEELLGTAGGVRACADFFGDEAVPGDLRRRAHRHRPDGVRGQAPRGGRDRHAGGQAGARHARVRRRAARPRGAHHGLSGEAPPDEALSDLGNCGIYVFDPRIFDYFPDRPFVDWAQDVFPALLENDVPFHIHEVREYWNDVGSLGELRQGTFDALRGELRLEMEGEEVRPG